METKTINLRDLPEPFVRRAKAYAALSGLTLKDFILQAVESAMQNEIQPKSSDAAFVKANRRKDKR
jgi:NRPS condensation-like uncharacterized protein